MFLLLRLLAAVVGGSVALAGANIAAFESRATALQQSWRQAEVAGVPADSLASARDDLNAARARRLGLIPAELTMNALTDDPLGPAELATQRAITATSADGRQRATALLNQLQAAGGVNYEPTYLDHLVRLSQATTPAQDGILVRQWQAELSRLSAQRTVLTSTAGGLTASGLPLDIANQVTGLVALQGQAETDGLWSDPSSGAIAQGQMFLRQDFAAQTNGHEQMKAELAAASNKLQGRVSTWTGAQQSLKQAEPLVATAQRLGNGGTLPARLQAARQALAGARDDAALQAAAKSATGVVNDARQAATVSAPVSVPVDTTTCTPSSTAQLIVIHLATQQLVASNGGCAWLRTPITTGRPALPTDRGTFSIFLKQQEWTMVSMWPKGSPFWYPTTPVYWAMEFVADGTFIHNANWQPSGSYGPGSQFGPYASHGCVHVPDGPLQRLYAWATIGTTVTVSD